LTKGSTSVKFAFLAVKKILFSGFFQVIVTKEGDNDGLRKERKERKDHKKEKK
jgi:hypothetical protein